MSPYVRRLREQLGSGLLELPAAGVIVFDDQRRILLVRHTEGVWTTPGGAVEPAESPADAAVREAYEETGLEVEIVRVLGVYGGPDFVVTYANGDETSYLMVYFEARVRGGSPRPDGEETLEVRYVAREDIGDLELPEWLYEVIDDAYVGRPEARFRAASWSPKG